MVRTKPISDQNGFKKIDESKSYRLALLIGASLTLALCSGVMAAPLGVGFQAGNLKFGETMTPADQAYLGLKNPGKFALKDIQADYVLVEVLNANCPFCIDQAATLNRLYRLVEASYKDRIKFIGVVSNSAAEASDWKRDYKVPFPIVADPEWVIGNDILKITGTPTTVVLDKQGKVIILHYGLFADADKAFQGLHAQDKMMEKGPSAKTASIGLQAVLVATNSPRAAAALHMAQILARPFSSKLILLHVIDQRMLEQISGYLGEPADALLPGFRRRAQQQMDENSSRG